MKECMHPNVHCSTIYNSQDMERILMSINRRLDKDNVVHIYNGVLAIKKNKIVPSAEMWMDLEIVLENQVNQKEKNKSITDMWNLEKCYR